MFAWEAPASHGAKGSKTREGAEVPRPRCQGTGIGAVTAPQSSPQGRPHPHQHPHGVGSSTPLSPNCALILLERAKIKSKRHASEVLAAGRHKRGRQRGWAPCAGRGFPHELQSSAWECRQTRRREQSPRVPHPWHGHRRGTAPHPSPAGPAPSPRAPCLCANTPRAAVR